MQNVKAFLTSVDVANRPSELKAEGIDIMPNGSKVWVFSWDLGSCIIKVDTETGKVVKFSDSRLYHTNEQRFKSGEAPFITTADEALRRALFFAEQAKLPVSQTKAEAKISTFEKPSSGGYFPTYTESPIGITEPGYWYVRFYRIHNGYNVFEDAFWVWLDLYEGNLMNFEVSWLTPSCETGVNLTQEDAVAQALDGFKSRGISAVAFNEQEGRISYPPRLVIIRPNYLWTDYYIPSNKIPYSRLAWLIRADNTDGSPVGAVYIDAATGEWLGGFGVSGRGIKMKSAPLKANAKAFLISRLAGSDMVVLNAVPKNQAVTITSKDKTRWAALGSLLASLRPLQLPPSGPGQECLTFTEKEKTYHLQRVKTGLRLEGPDVPGGAIGFAAGKDFAGKLVGITAPLAGAKKPPVAKK